MAIIGSGAGLGGIAGGNLTARLLIVVSGESRPLQSALASATGSLSNFNKNANAIGNAITRQVSLPLIGLGAVAIKTAMDFQSAMGRVAGLTDIVHQVHGGIGTLNKDLLEMAKIVPTGPTELANALYFAGSAGLSASQALDVVELSAKGAAIGMGQASDISKVLIFALNAYRGSGLSAAQAMDALTAAIRTGTAEPDEMAISLGRVLPVAALAGVAFNDVVASLAALTNIGLPARVATTSLRAVIAELLAPTQQASIKLKQLGLTTQQVRDALHAGPIVAFKLLEDAVHGDDDALRRILPQIRGFTAYAALMNDKGKEATRVINEVRNSTGSLDRAFKIISQTTQFKFGLALNQLRIAGIELGDKLFPVFLKLVGVLGRLGQALQDLPDWAQTAVAAFIVLGAAAGPLIKIYAFLQAGNFGLLTSFRGVASAVGILAIGMGFLFGAMNESSKGTASWSTILMGAAGAAAAAYVVIRNLAAVMTTLFNAGAISNSLGMLRFIMGLGTWGAVAAVAIGALVGTFLLLRNSAHEDARAATEFADSLSKLGTNANLTKQVVAELAKQNHLAGDAFERLVRETGSFNHALLPSLDKMRLRILPDLVGELRKIQDASFIDFGNIDFGKQTSPLTKYITLLNKYRGTSLDLNKILKTEGLTAKDLEADVNALAGAHSLEAKEVRELIVGGQALLKFYNDQRDLATAQVIAYGENKDAIQGLAKQYGVSTELMTNALNSVGVGAIGLANSSKEVQQQFAEQAGLIVSADGQIVAAEEAKAKAEADASAKIQEALQGQFKLFDKLPDKVKQTNTKLMGNLNAQVGMYTNFALNVQTLLRRGLNPEVLQQLVDMGPPFVAKFVNASTGELKKLETNYSVVMGAIDAVVLNEGDHQATKGITMVSKFAEAILSNKGLPVSAAQTIMTQMENQFSAGKWGRAALNGIIAFTDIITGPGSHLSRQAAGKVAVAFADKMAADPKFSQSGYGAILKWAQGAEKAGRIPEGTAKRIANAVATAFDTVNTKGPGVIHGLDLAHSALMQRIGAESTETKLSVMGVKEDIQNLPDKTVKIDADTSAADTALSNWINKVSSTSVHVIVHASWAMAGGGLVPGGFGGGDRVPTLLEPGEFVLRKEAVKKQGVNRLKEVNRMQQGGLVGRPNIWYNMPQPGGQEMELGATEWAKQNIRHMMSLVGNGVGSGTPAARRYQGWVQAVIPGGWRFGVTAHRFIAGTHTWSQHNWGNAVDAFNTMTKMGALANIAHAFSGVLRLAHLIWQTSVSSYGGPWQHYSGVPHTGHVHADFVPQYPLQGGGLTRRGFSANMHRNELILPLSSPRTQRVLGRALAYSTGSSAASSTTIINVTYEQRAPVYGVNDLHREVVRAVDKAVGRVLTR